MALIRPCFQGLLAFVLLITICARARAQGRAEVLLDLLDAFRPDAVRDALSCEVRRPASAAGVKEDALFEHPKEITRPARVDYRVTLPAITSDDLLLLVFDIALSDGIKPGTGEDGVRFSIEIDGKQYFAREITERRWQPH